MSDIDADHTTRPLRALVVGHFSTVGDIEVLSQVEKHLIASAVPYDIAPYLPDIGQNIKGSVRIPEVDANRYSHLFVVCGPFYRPYLDRYSIDLSRFAHCVRVGVNLTMIDPLEEWNPFHVLLGRDSDQWQRPDLGFREQVRKVPVAGLCLVRRQREYGERQGHDKAGDALRRAAERASMAVIELDTEWPARRNRSAISSPAQFESICARLDVMLTTRLHGTVLALKNGVPAVVLDPIVGGGKITRQARAIGWPEAYSIETVTDETLDAALRRCLDASARELAREVAARAQRRLSGFAEEFQDALALKPAPDLANHHLKPLPAPQGLHQKGRQFIRNLRSKVSQKSKNLLLHR